MLCMLWILFSLFTGLFVAVLIPPGMRTNDASLATHIYLGRLGSVVMISYLLILAFSQMRRGHRAHWIVVTALNIRRDMEARARHQPHGAPNDPG